MRRILCLLAAALLMPALVPAASTPTTPSRRLAGTFVPCDTLFGHGQLDSLLRRLDRIEAGAPADSDLQIVSGSYRALVLALNGHTDRVAALSGRALARSRQDRDTLLECRALAGLALSSLFTPDTAGTRRRLRQLLELSRAGGKSYFEAQARLNLAYLEVQAGRAESARQGYLAALQLFSPARDVVPRRIARVGLARALGELYRFDEQRNVNIALVRECRRNGDRLNEAYTLNNMAVMEIEIGDPSEAIPFYERAIELLREAGDRKGRLVTSVNLGAAYIRLGRSGEAASLLQAELDTLDRRMPADARGSLLENLGAARIQQGRRQVARQHIFTAWAVLDSANLSPSYSLVSNYARMMADDGKVDEAVHLLDDWVARGLAHGTSDFARSVSNTAAEILSNHGRPDEAMKRWREILGGIDSLRPGGQYLRAAVLLSMAQGHLRRGDVANARGEALESIRLWEKARSGIRSAEWREAPFGPAAEGWPGLARALLACEPGERRADREAAAFAELQRLKARTFSERAIRRAPLAIGDARRFVQDLLGEGELFLDVHPERDSIYVFALSRTEFRLARLSDAAALRDRLDRFRELLVGPQSSDRAFEDRAAVELGETLWGPIRELLAGKRRVIVSDGGLGAGIPWGLLRVPGSADPALVNFEFATVPSLEALAIVRSPHPNRGEEPLLVLAGAGDARARRLPGVKEESNWLAGRYAPVIVSMPRSSAEATRALGSAPRFSCIHVAAHFADDAENPWNAGVLFGDPARDDAYLRTRDLDTGRVSSRLVVLSGCSSAGEHAIGLEADRGLASAFLAAGAGAVVGTLWPVTDEASAEFTKRFYRSLEQGRGAALALAMAQRELRAQGSDTRDWAGFVLLGDPEQSPRLRRR